VLVHPLAPFGIVDREQDFAALLSCNEARNFSAALLIKPLQLYV
jgi:hypothetical protein